MSNLIFLALSLSLSLVIIHSLRLFACPCSDSGSFGKVTSGQGSARFNSGMKTLTVDEMREVVEGGLSGALEDKVKSVQEKGGAKAAAILAAGGGGGGGGEGRQLLGSLGGDSAMMTTTTTTIHVPATADARWPLGVNGMRIVHHERGRDDTQGPWPVKRRINGAYTQVSSTSVNR